MAKYLISYFWVSGFFSACVAAGSITVLRASACHSAVSRTTPSRIHFLDVIGFHRGLPCQNGFKVLANSKSICVPGPVRILDSVVIVRGEDLVLKFRCWSH